MNVRKYENEITIVNDRLYFQQVTIKLPEKCMCKPCGSIEESEVVPQEIVPYLDQEPVHGHFANTEYRYRYS